MKKIFAAILTLSLVFTFGTVTVFAESGEQTGETEQGTTLTFDYQLDPTYTVTIPSSVTLDKAGTPVVFEATDVENLNGKRISVTVAGTSAFRDQFIIEGKDQDGSRVSMRFSIAKANGEELTTNAGAGIENLNGTELAAFTENGSQTLTFAPIIENSSTIRPGAVYTGTITYGISLV